MVIETLELKQFMAFLKPRPKDAHKGLYGHVLIVGSDEGFSGASRMAAEAALRVGAGLVSVATRPDIAQVLNLNRPEIMSHGVQTTKMLKRLLPRATVIGIGPGLGTSTWAKSLFQTVLKSKKPLVVDADALNLLAKKPRKYTDWILTPHPGEAARLLKMSTEDIQRDRVSAVKKLQEKYGGVCVLKGYNSLIAGPKNQMAQCTAGNPGMATAGMGDILTGVIAGLVGGGLPLMEAASLGVLVHAKAGDLASMEGERGMIATDLFPYLRQLMNSK
jgi:ADP-dependent NAD(P)H-hydrate dehydratase / NAD(P)H-hydrate epimerase